jgi:hypothetical protein
MKRKNEGEERIQRVYTEMHVEASVWWQARRLKVKSKKNM